MDVWVVFIVHIIFLEGIRYFTLCETKTYSSTRCENWLYRTIEEEREKRLEQEAQARQLEEEAEAELRETRRKAKEEREKRWFIEQLCPLLIWCSAVKGSVPAYTKKVFDWFRSTNPNKNLTLTLILTLVSNEDGNEFVIDDWLLIANKKTRSY